MNYKQLMEPGPELAIVGSAPIPPPLACAIIMARWIENRLSTAPPGDTATADSILTAFDRNVRGCLERRMEN